MSDVELSPDQEHAVQFVRDWYKTYTGGVGGRQYVTLGGLAGTGKTTIIAELARRMPEVRTRWCAYTGKAAAVLRGRLRDAGVQVDTLRPGQNGEPREVQLVSTVHSLIKTHHEVLVCVRSGRTVPQDEDGHARRPCGACRGTPCRFVLQGRFGDKPADQVRVGLDLVVLDEASMIGKDLWRDLLSYDIPILAVGDHGQLPPVKAADVGLMENPDVRLEKLHRFGELSGINVLAHEARSSGRVPYGRWDLPEGYAAKIAPNGAGPTIDISDDAGRIVWLTGRRATRSTWNRRLREDRGLAGRLPQVGDRLICLRNTLTTYNGMIADVRGVGAVGDETVELLLTVDGEDDRQVVAAVAQFGRDDTLSPDELRRRELRNVTLWDYAYALTVHKAQGSGFPRVVVMEERLPGGDEKHARWLYTAITRAEKKVLVIG